MKKILFIVGSLREHSFNKQMAQFAETLLKGKAQVHYLNFADVPVFNQDLEANMPESVQKVREDVLNADAIWLFSPVYNHAIPGAVKNLLDWLSRSLNPKEKAPSAVVGKSIATCVFSSSGQEKVAESLKALLSFIKMELVGEVLTAKVNPEAWVDGHIILSEETKQGLDVLASELLK